MKKILVALLAVVLLLSVVGCNKTPPEVPDNIDKDIEQNQDDEQLLHPDDYDEFLTDIYLCDDVYRTDDTPTHGSGTISLPMSQDVLELKDYQILLCGDGCPPESVVSRASQGYAPAYRVVPDGEIDGNFKTLKFKMKVDEAWLNDTINSGINVAIEETLGSKYFYLLVLDEKHYAYIHLEVIDGVDSEVEHEAELADAIVKNARVQFTALPSEPVTDYTVELQDIKLDMNEAQLLDTASVYFTEVLGTRKRYPDSLPVITGFQYPYVFYERMTVLVEGAGQDDAALYVGRYSMETKEAQEFAIESFTAISDEARLVVDEERIVYMYCTFDEQGNLIMNIELFDYLNNTQKIISAHSAHNVFGYAKKLCEDELVFFLYESVPSGTQQLILHYDLQTETLNEIYRGQNMTGYSDSQGSTKDIWAIDADNGNINLLMQQFIDGKMVSYLRTIDSAGNTVNEKELSALSMYDSLEDTADSLVCRGDYVFIHYSQFNKSEDNTNAPFAILRKVNTDYHLLEIDGDVMPKMLSGIGSSDIPYVFYQIYESEQTMFSFNVNTREGFLLELPGDGIQNFVVDSSGNLLIAARTDEKTSWYFFPSEYVLEKQNR